MNLAIDYLAGAKRLSGELAALRWEFHREPELGNKEFKTAKKTTMRALKKMDMP